MSIADASPGLAPYLTLIHRFPLRPIRTPEDLDRATAMIDELIARPDLADAERDYLDILSDIAARYESSEHPLPPASQGDLLRYMMSTRDLNPETLAAETGLSGASIAEVLSGRRMLTGDELATVSSYFRVAPGTFPEG